MKALVFFPLAYLVPVQMFPLVALYLVLFMVLVLTMKHVQQSRQRRVMPVTVRSQLPRITSHL